VAAHEIPIINVDERRFLELADRPELAVAASMEDAATRRLARTRELTLALDPPALGGHEAGTDQRGGSLQGWWGVANTTLGEADFHGSAEVHDSGPVGATADDAEVVRDEEVGEAFSRLEVGQQVETAASTETSRAEVGSSH
jgi:hypothetical protein